MSGLLSGLMLRRAGWTVDIYERVESELSGRGAGIVAQYELIERLRGAGACHRRARRRHHHPQDPRPRGPPDRRDSIARRCSPPGSASTGCCATLFRPSAIIAGAGLPASRQAPHSVLARFFRRRNDRSRSAGRRRRHALDRAPAGAARSRAALCRLLRLARADRGERIFRPTSHRELFEYMTFTLPPGEQLLGYPVAGPDNDLRPGHRRYNVVWYRPADEQTKLPWLLTDERGTTTCDLDPAAADPPRGDRRNARRCRAAGWGRSSARSCG